MNKDSQVREPDLLEIEKQYSAQKMEQYQGELADYEKQKEIYQHYLWKHVGKVV